MGIFLFTSCPATFFLNHIEITSTKIGGSNHPIIQKLNSIMNKIFNITVSLLLSVSTVLSAPSVKTSLAGTVTDKITGETLVGVNIYFPDLKIGTSTDLDGKYKIDNLPETKVLVQVTYIGYKNLVQTIDLDETNTANFELEVSAIEMNAIVVTGLSQFSEKMRTYLYNMLHSYNRNARTNLF